MTAVSRTAQLEERFIEIAASWYEDEHVPATFADLPPALIAYARKACEGDWRRCVRSGPDSIDIMNRAVWR